MCGEVYSGIKSHLADGDSFLPGGTGRCLQRLTVSEQKFSFAAGIALKSLDFVSAFIKHGPSLLHEALWRVFYLPTMPLGGILKTQWL